jgi:hypothetical protein
MKSYNRRDIKPLARRSGQATLPVMTYARAHLVDFKNGGFYHCTSRCVRRAWLCGEDPVTGRSYDHRKQWLEDRILSMVGIFAVDLHGYSVLSNHYHVVLNVKPRVAAAWSDDEVARRWVKLMSAKSDDQRCEVVATMLANQARLNELRRRLGSLSWFMRYINEPMARRANKEDDCKGRFWEGRFASSALLDDAAILACMAYVDLNPIRAGISVDVRDAPHTSINRRLNPTDSGSMLTPLSAIGITLDSYLLLLDRTVSSDEICADDDAMLPRRILGQDLLAISRWRRVVEANRYRYRAYGSTARLREYASQIGQNWLKGQSLRG